MQHNIGILSVQEGLTHFSKLLYKFGQDFLKIQHICFCFSWYVSQLSNWQIIDRFRESCNTNWVNTSLKCSIFVSVTDFGKVTEQIWSRLLENTAYLHLFLLICLATFRFTNLARFRVFGCSDRIRNRSFRQTWKKMNRIQQNYHNLMNKILQSEAKFSIHKPKWNNSFFQMKRQNFRQKFFLHFLTFKNFRVKLSWVGATNSMC